MAREEEEEVVVRVDVVVIILASRHHTLEHARTSPRVWPAWHDISWCVAPHVDTMDDIFPNDTFVQLSFFMILFVP